MQFASLCATALIIGGTAALGPDLSDVCQAAAGTYLYSDYNTSLGYDYCASAIIPGVIALCYDQYFHSHATKYWHKFVESDYCDSGFTDDYQSILTNATAFLVAAPETALNVTDAPFIVPQDTYEEWYNTDYAYFDNVFLAQTYGWIIIVTGCFIMAMAGTLRFFKHATGSGRSSNALVTTMEKYITVPALFGQAHAYRPSLFGFQFSIPTRLQAIFLFIYIVVNIVLSFTPFKIFEGNLYWADSRGQWTRYVADRTGILSFAQFPFLFAFAGRNTIFLWVTGWSYQTFSVFHKWVARMCVLQAMMHTIAYTISFYDYGGYEYMAESYDYPYLRWGAVAMIAGFLLVSHAVYSLRKRWYEIFVASHIVFAIIWVVGCYYHIKLLGEEKDYMPWLWTAVAFWAFDRAVRVLRLVAINVNWGGRKGDSLSDVQVLDDDVLKLTIPISGAWSSTSGHYVFVYFPSFKFWQSHPFTIVSINEADPSAVARVTEMSGVKDKSAISAFDTVEVAASSDVVSAHGKTMTLLFRAHKGVTRQLLDAAAKNAGGRLRTRVLLEGPYGSGHDLARFDKVVLIAAGLGITAVLPFLSSLSPTSSMGNEKEGREVVLHWVMREARSLAWLKSELDAVLASGAVRVVVHVTHPSSSSSSSSSPPGEIRLLDGHPDLKDVVATEITQAAIGASVAVVSCGPAGVSDDVRAGVVRQTGVREGGKVRAVKYFEESFTW